MWLYLDTNQMHTDFVVFNEHVYSPEGRGRQTDRQTDRQTKTKH